MLLNRLNMSLAVDRHTVRGVHAEEFERFDGSSIHMRSEQNDEAEALQGTVILVSLMGNFRTANNFVTLIWTVSPGRCCSVKVMHLLYHA
jgi:hypothetical protein